MGTTEPERKAPLHGPGLGRRTFLAGGGLALGAGVGLGLGLGLAPPARAQAVPDGFRVSHALTYRIFRGDDLIGQSVFTFHTRGETDLAVVTRTSIDVRVLLYSYASNHVATEVWENGVLTALDTRTDDDGEPFRVTGRRVAEGFEITGDAGTIVAPAGTPPKSFWNRGILHAPQVITTKRGALETVRANTLQRETVSYTGGQAEATCYRLETDDTIDLWYSDDGLLVKALRDTFGGDILYLLDTTTPPQDG